MNELKTGEQWEKELLIPDGSRIHDPDGFDRQNYQYSFCEELISKEDFMNKLMICTCRFSKVTMDKLLSGKL